MATTSSSLPEEQQPEQAVAYPEAVPSNSWHSSGSMGPFFAVISVLTVLTVISCILPKICKGPKARVTPLETIMHRGCFGWIRRRFFGCMDSDAEVLGDKAMAGPKESSEGKAQDGV